MLRYLYRSVSSDTKNTTVLNRPSDLLQNVFTDTTKYTKQFVTSTNHDTQTNTNEKERKSDVHRPAKILKSDLVHTHTHTHTHTHRSSPYRTVTHFISVIKTSQLMLYREIIAVCSEIHTKHINTLCGQNVELYIKTQSVPHSKHTPSRL